MKKQYIILSLLVLTVFQLSLSSASPADPSQDFASGSESYKAGNYQAALDSWLKLYQGGMHSAAIDYNIGNAYFKLGKVPESILFYERAHLLKPADEDISYNLQIARTLVVDKFAEIPELFFKTWYDFISLTLSTNLWALLCLIGFIFFLLALSVYFYSKKYILKVSGFWLALLFLVISLSSYSFSVRNKNLVFNSKTAIIMSPQVNGKSSPDESGKDLFVLHEGTKVTVGDMIGDWFEIRLSDGNKGWVPSNTLEKL